MPIPLGKFYEIDVPRFDQEFPGYDIKFRDRNVMIGEILDNFI